MRLNGLHTISGAAKTQKGGMISSLKFSYWSSPQITTKSGAKSSRTRRTAREASNAAEGAEAALLVNGARGGALVGAPCRAHGRGPAGGVAPRLGHAAARQ